MPQPAAMPLYFPGGLTTPPPGVMTINVSGIINSFILQSALFFNPYILTSSNFQILKSSFPKVKKSLFYIFQNFK